MAQYLLDSVGYKGNGKILYLSIEQKPDYLRCLTLIGLKELLGDRIVDVPKIKHIYKTFTGDTPLYSSKGFSYTKIVDDLPVDRENIEQRIRNKEFDLVIYGSIHRGCPYSDPVLQTYEPEKIVWLCGEDAHKCSFDATNFFIREFENIERKQ